MKNQTHLAPLPGALAGERGGQMSVAQVAGVFGLAAAVTLVSIAWVDRPVAVWAHGSLEPYRSLFVALTHIVDPIPVIAGGACLVYAVLALCGYTPGPRGRVALRIALAVVVAIYLKDGLKGLAGRSWPETWTAGNPSYFRDGVYGFFPWQGFNGTRAFQAFPSGHMTAVSSGAVGFALAYPRWRMLALAAVVAVAVGLVGADFHWVSDVIAGTLLGSSVALAAYRVHRRFYAE